MTKRRVIAAALLAAFAAIFLAGGKPSPTPAPLPPDAFTLRGKFVGPDAAADAASLAALCEELASVIEWDGIQPEPRLKTGASIDELRVVAREARMKGVSIGDRQPKARDAIHKFLDESVGTSGGPVGPEARSKWVAAFRDIARACADASR
jgi:hypothetical protein